MSPPPTASREDGFTVHRLKDMVRGWFVGNFTPTAVRSTEVEVAVQSYRAGDHERWHVHRIATEITVVVSGRVTMNGKPFEPGDIVTISPGFGTDFLAVDDAVTVVVKLPSVANDKHFA